MKLGFSIYLIKEPTLFNSDSQVITKECCYSYTVTPTFLHPMWQHQHLHHIYFFLFKKGDGRRKKKNQEGIRNHTPARNHATGRGRRVRKPRVQPETEHPVGGKARTPSVLPQPSRTQPEQVSPAVSSVSASLPLVLFTIFDRFIGRKPAHTGRPASLRHSLQ
jgi:hypothetical protein